MSIGTTLSQAREAAGLSVADVSSRTRIRAPLIRAIEADDFGPCGGDFYARGHIRAIARTVGVDPRPLTDAYDGLTPGPPPADPAALEDLFRPAPAPAPPGEPAPAAAPGEGEASPPAGAPKSVFPKGGFAPFSNPLHGGTARPPVPPSGAPSGPRGRLPAAVLALLALIALAVIGVGAYRLASGGPAATAAGSPRSSAPAAAAPAGRSAPASPSTAPSPSTPPPKVTLTRVTPSGASADDNGADAFRALGDDAADPWHTHWYTSAAFGNLKPGTGLTLTLPRTVTAAGVTVKFASSGAAMQVRAGTSPGSLKTVATDGSAGGTASLSFAGTSARYIELWFTRLGTSGSGSYQVSVYDVSVSAQRSS